MGGMQTEERRRELVALFEGHGALAEPALLVELSEAPDGAVRAQSLLASLQEVPFHFDRSLWSRLEQQHRETLSSASPPPAATAAPESAAARKEAMRRPA